ncbi:hypothetical protein TWF970_008708 [Orbilia oligospora]|uniref:C-type lectin domain-containing protein n=1 Tax=Orbilia oligospora TaxID=2813651 RepID=A0A7C8REM7_ORBOL|nr:hypothetical protein TWF970_008708 [Orbilia oligospora]
MKSFVTKFLLLSGASLVTSAPNPVHILQKRTGSNGCNADNLLRLLRNSDNIGEAVVFCSTYLNLPGTTITVATVTPTLTISETTTITVVDEVEETLTKTLIFTDIDTVVNTVTDCATSTKTATQTDTIVTIITQNYVKRNTHAPLTERVATYPPDRISSACSCLTVPLEIIPVTYTAPTVTITASDSLTTEITKTLTETVDVSKTIVEVTETVTTVTNYKEVEVTTTLTTIATFYTHVPPPPPEKFVLRSNGPGVSQHYLKAVSHNNSPFITHAIFVSDKAQATVWFLDSENRLSYNNAGQSNSVWVSYTLGSADPREILWDSPSSVNGNFLKWTKHANGNVVPNDAVLDKLQSCVPVEADINGAKTLFIGSFIDNKNDCKSVDLHPEAPL